MRHALPCAAGLLLVAAIGTGARATASNVTCDVAVHQVDVPATSFGVGEVYGGVHAVAAAICASATADRFDATLTVRIEYLVGAVWTVPAGCSATTWGSSVVGVAASTVPARCAPAVNAPHRSHALVSVGGAVVDEAYSPR